MNILTIKGLLYNIVNELFSSVQSFSHVRPFATHGLQHARPPCPSPTPRVYSNSCPLSWWCYPTISSSVVPFSSHLQSFQASWSFQMSQFFSSGSQSIGVSASTSVPPMNIEDWSPLGWTGWVSLQSNGLSKVFSNSTVQEYQFSSVQLSLQFNSHIHTWLLKKNISLTRWTLVGKVKSLLFNMPSRLVITFLPRRKHLLISWLQWFSPSAVISEPPKIKSVTISIVSPSTHHEVMGLDAMTLVFEMLRCKPTFSLSSFTFVKRLFSSSLSAIRVVSSAYLRLLIFLPANVIPDCLPSSAAFLMMYSAYKLNKQGDNVQPSCTPFPIWNQSVVPCPVLTVASWPIFSKKKKKKI